MDRMSTAKLEERIVALETEVAELKRQLATQSGQRLTGWRTIVGTMPDDEITRRAEQFGREYRESFRPKPRKGKKKRARARHRSHEPAPAR
jgi:hypothetical protein